MKWFIFFLLCGFPLAVFAQSEVYFNQPLAEKTVVGRGSQELILVQSGQLNQVQYREQGVHNRVRIRQQGSQNEVNLDVPGNDNQYSVTQKGNRNLMEWGAVQQNNGQLDVLQRGNNNQLIREGSATATGVSMQIEQTGGMKVIIRNGL